MENYDSFFEMVVKLAAAGTAGLSIFIVMALSYVLYKLPETTPHEKHVTLRFFIGALVVIVFFSTCTTGLSAYWDFRGKAAAQKKADNLQVENKAQEETIKVKDSVIDAKSAVLEARTLETTQLKDITKDQQTHIAVLKTNYNNSVASLEAATKLANLYRAEQLVQDKFIKEYLAPSAILTPDGRSKKLDEYLKQIDAFERQKDKMSLPQETITPDMLNSPEWRKSLDQMTVPGTSMDY